MGVREEALSSSIRGRLIDDSRVGDLPISTYIVDGDVYLIGRVNTLEQKDIAEFIVRGIPGVRHVNTDELEVRSLYRRMA
jgi:osmotically-inducible protein OsmY